MPITLDEFQQGEARESLETAIVGFLRSRPTEAFTVKSLPRNLLIVFAFAGDSTMTRFFATQDPSNACFQRENEASTGFRQLESRAFIFRRRSPAQGPPVGRKR